MDKRCVTSVVTLEEAARIRAFAQAERRSVSNLIRTVILDHIAAQDAAHPETRA